MNEPATNSSASLTPQAQSDQSAALLGKSFRQLVLMPLVIVAIAVAVSVLFSRLADDGTSPEDLVRDLRELESDRWQKAYMLTVLLRDPKHAALRQDASLCRQLAQILEAEQQVKKANPDRARLRFFLCRLLGEFHTTSGLPALTTTANNRNWSIDTRRAAVEAIAVLANHVGSDTVATEPKVIPTLLDISRERFPSEQHAEQTALRATAAFALGVLETTAADEQLAKMLNDGEPTVRFNAATGLARRADLRAIPVLTEMLERHRTGPAAADAATSSRNQMDELAISAAIRAAGRFKALASHDDVADLANSLRALSENPQVRHDLRLEAMEVERALSEARHATP
jgi:HEAT repeat protein